MKTRVAIAATIIGLGSLSLPANAATPTDAEINKKFQALHSDKIPHNCEQATVWLIQHADDVRDKVLTQLYATDNRQTKDALLHVLFNTPSLIPDARFCRTVIARLPEQNRYIQNHTIFHSDDVETDRISEEGVHWEAWKYISNHFDSFESLLRAQVASTDNEWVVWGAAWLLKHLGTLEQHRDWFTPAVLSKAAANLKNDRKSYNASQAVRLFFLLGEQSVPILQETSKSSDAQARDLARATLDAFKADHDAFGFLSARVNLDEVLFGEQAESPEWIQDAIEPYLDNQKPYRAR